MSKIEKGILVAIDANSLNPWNIKAQNAVVRCAVLIRASDTRGSDVLTCPSHCEAIFASIFGK